MLAYNFIASEKKLNLRSGKQACNGPQLPGEIAVSCCCYRLKMIDIELNYVSTVIFL